MPCKDCQCSKNADQSLSDQAKSLEIADPRESRCSCSSRNSSECTAAGCTCSCCRPRRRNCSCCSCSSCCSCCPCCSPGGVRSCAGLLQKNEVKTKSVQDIVTSSCKCCESKPKKVCANCGCDKCI